MRRLGLFAIVAALAVGTSSLAFAQSTTSQTPRTEGEVGTDTDAATQVPPPPPPPPPVLPPPPAAYSDQDAPGGGTAQRSEFADWAVAVVAADWRSSRGQPIRAFENARRDLSAAFGRVGFTSGNLASLSLAPNAAGEHLRPQDAFSRISSVTNRATAGCLLYFTSHGSPSGIVWGPEGTLAPQIMDRLIDDWCGTRPTVVVVSACYSGVFVPALAQSNRMIMTAARRDRSSFGCSEDDTHPYFDACVLEALDDARDFLNLSMRATACVNRREREAGLSPPSEPQTYVGAQMQTLLPFLQFR